MRLIYHRKVPEMWVDRSLFVELWAGDPPRYPQSSVLPEGPDSDVLQQRRSSMERIFARL